MRVRICRALAQVQVVWRFICLFDIFGLPSVFKQTVCRPNFTWVIRRYAQPILAFVMYMWVSVYVS